MFKRLFKDKWYLIVILILVILEPSLTSWMYLWLQKIYNGVGIGTPVSYIVGALLIGVAAWMGKRLLLFTISICKAKFICNIKQDLKENIFVRTMKLDTASLNNVASSGEFISIFTNDISILEQRYFSNIVSLCSNIISLLILGTAFFSMAPKLAIIVFIFSLIVMFVPLFFSKKLNDSNLAYSKKLSDFTQKIKEFFNGYSTIKNYSIESAVTDKFITRNNDVEDSKFIYDCQLSQADSAGSLITWFTRVIVIGVGLVLISKGQMLLGTIISAEAFAEEIAHPLQGIVENANSIHSVKSIVRKIDKILKNEKENEEHDEVLKGKNLTIEFKNLTINVNDKTIVNNFSFKFEPSKKYLIVGKNGAGKSSLFKALKNNFNDYDGEILVNGINIKQISRKEISRKISYLNENVALFSESLKDNITFWDSLDNANLDKVLKKSHIKLDESRMIGENGYNISSGEQRRIELARSMMSDARTLIYDEVVSTLDIETAYDIENDALNAKDKMIIFISHNFSGKLLKKYDSILVMKDAKLVANGTYEELINKSSYFRKICSIKFGIPE